MYFYASEFAPVVSHWFYLVPVQLDTRVSPYFCSFNKHRKFTEVGTFVPSWLAVVSVQMFGT